MNPNSPPSKLTQVFDSWHLPEMPLLFPALGLAAGIALAGWLQNVAVFALPALFIVAGLFLRRPRVALTAVFALAGTAVMWLNLPEQPDLPAKGEFRGEVAEVAEGNGEQRLIVSVNGDVRVALTLYDFDYQIIKGDSVSFAGMLFPPVREVSIPGEDDGSLTALRHRLSARCRVQEGSFRILRQATGWNAMMFRLREGFRQLVRDSGVSQPTEQFLVAVLMGDNRVEQAVRDDFSRAGMSHLLALSGMHVGIIALLMAIVFMPVEMAGSRKWRMLITLVALWGYAFFTGMMPSVARATIMASFVLGARMLGLKNNPMNALCAAAICILCVSPEQLFMPGFQLSFVAVVGILMLMPFRELLGWRNRWARGASEALWLPVSAVVATAPLSAWHFHLLPTMFLVGNLPAAMLLPAIFASGILLIILTAAGISAGWLAWLTDSLCGVVEWLAQVVGTLPGATLGEIYFPGWLLVPTYGSLFIIWLAFRTEERKYLVNGTILLIFTGFLFYFTKPDYPEREMYSWPTANSTNILVKAGDKLVIYSDISPVHINELRERAKRQLRGYLERRHLADTLEIRELGELGKSVAGGQGLFPENVKRPSLVLPRRYRGPILETSRNNPGKELVLSAAIPPVRRKAFADTLTAAGIKFRYEL